MSKYATLDEKKNGSLPEHVDEDDDIQSVSILSRASASVTRSRHRVVDDESLKEPLTATDTDDPFYVFREDLYRKLDLVEENLTEYLRIVHQTDTAVNTHALNDSKKQLKRHLKNAESTLKDVQMTISLVEQDRDKFSHITNGDLYDRKALVNTSQERLSRAKQDMHSTAVKSKLMEDERAKAMRRAALQDDGREQTAFIADSAARTSLLMQQQDETLDDLDEAVVRVGNMATSIHQEIGQQNKILNEMDDDLADAEEKLGVVMGKLGKLLKTKDKCQLGTILALIVTVIVLFFLVIYT
jgi:syntaxin 6